MRERERETGVRVKREADGGRGANGGRIESIYQRILEIA